MPFSILKQVENKTASPTASCHPLPEPLPFRASVGNGPGGSRQTPQTPAAGGRRRVGSQVSPPPSLAPACGSTGLVPGPSVAELSTCCVRTQGTEPFPPVLPGWLKGTGQGWSATLPLQGERLPVAAAAGGRRVQGLCLAAFSQVSPREGRQDPQRRVGKHSCDSPSCFLHVRQGSL